MLTVTRATCFRIRWGRPFGLAVLTLCCAPWHCSEPMSGSATMESFLCSQSLFRDEHGRFLAVKSMIKAALRGQTSQHWIKFSTSSPELDYLNLFAILNFCSSIAPPLSSHCIQFKFKLDFLAASCCPSRISLVKWCRLTWNRFAVICHQLRLFSPSRCLGQTKWDLLVLRILHYAARTEFFLQRPNFSKHIAPRFVTCTGKDPDSLQLTPQQTHVSIGFTFPKDVDGI